MRSALFVIAMQRRFSICLLIITLHRAVGMCQKGVIIGVMHIIFKIGYYSFLNEARRRIELVWRW